jgi:hypothetical protein
MTRPGIPERLLQRLDDLGAALADRGDVVALIALGSVGVDRDRLDDHSDLDFFVIVDDDARQRYLDSIDWLEELSPVAFSFPNTVDGRKVLFADGSTASTPFSPSPESPRAPHRPAESFGNAPTPLPGWTLPGACPGLRRATRCSGRRTRRSRIFTSHCTGSRVASCSARRG